MKQINILFLKAVIFCITVFSLCSAQNVTVFLTDSLPQSSKTIYLKGYSNGEWVLLDSSVFTSADPGNAIILGSKKHTGTGILFIGKQPAEALDFIIVPEEKIIITTSTDKLQKGKARISNSAENTLYEKLGVLKINFDLDTKEWFRARSKLSRYDSLFHTKANNLMYRIDERKKLFNDSVTLLQAKYPQTFAMQVTANFLKMPNRVEDNIPSTVIDNIEAYQFYHFFDKINWANPLTSNHFALLRLVNSYMDNYVNEGDKLMLKACDIVMEKAKQNSTNQTTVFKILLDYAAKRNLEYLVKYVYDTYSDNCMVNIDFSEHKQLANIKNTMVGATIPDVALYDVDGTIRSLNNELKQKKVTLLYIWLSSCHACAQKTPELKKIVDEFQKGVQVFAISLDANKDEWKKAMNAYGINNWINVAELVELNKSTIAPKYNTRTTPKLFVLDSSGKIVSRDTFGKELESELRGLLK